jgi:hypothetical protein
MKRLNRPPSSELKPTGDVFNDAGACAFLITTPRTLRLWRRTLGLPHIRVTAKSLRYRKADLEEWLARRRVAVKA